MKETEEGLGYREKERSKKKKKIWEEHPCGMPTAAASTPYTLAYPCGMPTAVSRGPRCNVFSRLLLLLLYSRYRS